MKKTYSLLDIRLLILEKWNVAPAAAKYSAWERANLEEAWSELKAVERAEAWRATTGLAAQLVEAHLKQRLILAGRPFPQVAQATLNPLIKMALKDGVFAASATFSIADSIFAAKKLRNWASHGAAWLRAPSELHATHSLIYLVCYSGWFFPETAPLTEAPADVDDAWWADHAHLVDSGLAAQRIWRILESNAPIVDEELAALIGQVIHYGGIGAVENLLTRLRRRRTASIGLADLIHENFVYLLANAGRGKLDNLQTVIRRLHGVGLPTHSRLLAACLPRTPDALAYFLRRAPMRFVDYLQACKVADPEAYERDLSTPGAQDPLVTGLFRFITHRRGKLNTFAIVLSHLPRPTVAQVLQASRIELVSWVKELSTWDSTPILRTLLQRNLRTLPEARDTLDECINAIVEKVNSRPLSESESVVWSLSLLRVSMEPDVKPIYEALLSLIPSTSGADAMLVQRILWDLMQYAPGLQDDAVEAATSILRESPDLPVWPRLCLAGALCALGQQPHTHLTPEIVSTAAEEISGNRWEVFRVGLACAHGDSDTRKAAVPILEAAAALLVDTKTRSDSYLTRRLIQGVTEATRTIRSVESYNSRVSFSQPPPNGF